MKARWRGGEGRRRSWRVLGLATLGIALPACGNDSPPLESASVCMEAWQPLTTARPYDVTSQLVYQDDTLYLSTALEGILSLPTTASQPTPLSSMSSLELWIEGDHLFFSGGAQATQIWSLPLAGGTAQLIADGGAGRTNVGISLHHAFTDTDFIWTEQSFGEIGPTTVWRMSRSGGDPIQFGSATAVVPMDSVGLGFSAIALASEGVVLAADFGIADLVPYDGGPTRPLAVPTASSFAYITLAGVDPAGAYWLIPRPLTSTSRTWCSRRRTAGRCRRSGLKRRHTPGSLTSGRTARGAG